MVLGEIQPRDVPDSLREKQASRLQHDVEPGEAPEFKVRVRVPLRNGQAPESVECGPGGVRIDGELIPVRVSAPALAQTKVSKKSRELVVTFPEGLFERKHWWHEHADVLTGGSAPDGALSPEARADASDLGLLGDKPFRLSKPKFAPPGRGKQAEAPRRGAALVARTALDIGQVVLREEPLLRAAQPADVLELFGEDEEDSPVLGLAASCLAAKKHPRERSLTLRRLALLQDIAGHKACDVADPVPGGGLTDAQELATLLALLHAGSHVTDEEPCVFFALHLVQHSCEPNCVLVQDGSEYQLVAVDLVAAGEPLTLDLLQFPRAYQPRDLREAALVEAGIGHATARPSASVRVFVCPACAKGALCPLDDAGDLTQLTCVACGLEADAGLVQECADAEREHDERPQLLVQPEGRLHPLHYLNVQLAATYLFELAPLHDQALRTEHRQVAELLVHACTRLRGTPCTPELRPLYQVLAVLWEYLNPDEEQLDEQRRYLTLVDELSAAFFPRACENDRQLYEKAFGAEGARDLGLIMD